MRQLNVRIQEDVYESLKQESINQRLSMSRLVEYYVVEGVNQKPKNLIKKFMGL